MMATGLDAYGRWVYVVGLTALALAVLAVVLACITAPGGTGAGPGQVAAQQVPVLLPERPPSDDLQRRIARRPEPLLGLRGKGPVKNDGTADKMARRLKLQATAKMRGEYVAYVCVDGKSVAKIRQGGTILEFSVVRVEASSVVLSREGVQVVLPQPPA